MVFSGVFIALPGLRRLGPPHVRHRHGPVADTFFALTDDADRRSPPASRSSTGSARCGAARSSSRRRCYFAVGFIAMFIIGGLSGVMHASPPADLQQTDTYFVVAHFHYVLFGGSIFGLSAGAYYWWPKMFGRMLDERLGKLHFWLMLIGFNLTFFPMHFVGLQRHAAAGVHLSGRARLRDSTTRSRRRARSCWRSRFWCSSSTSSRPGGGRPNAPADPWNGATLEWSIPSPPQEFNFAEVPVVHGRDPLWEAKRQRGGPAAGAGAGERGRASTCRTRPTGRWWRPSACRSVFLVADAAADSSGRWRRGGGRRCCSSASSSGPSSRQDDGDAVNRHELFSFQGVRS